MARNSKKISFVFVGAMITIAIFAGIADAGVAPAAFETREACHSAVLSGEGAYRIYVPKDLSGAGKNPVDGITKVMAPLETVIGVACVEMNTQWGRKFVPQSEGTEFRFKVNADGSRTPYARHDCGNKVYSISHPTPKQSEPEKKAEVKAEIPRSGYQVGDPCMALTPDEKSTQGVITQVFSDGGASCDAVVEVSVPSKGKAIAQYIICPLAGGLVGGYRSGFPGAITGAVAGAGGTYTGRELGGENWGWTGCVTGPLAGLIKWGDGESSLVKGMPVKPPTAGGPINPY